MGFLGHRVAFARGIVTAYYVERGSKEAAKYGIALKLSPEEVIACIRRVRRIVGGDVVSDTNRR